MAPHFIFKPLSSDLSQFYVRAWVKFPVDMGGGTKAGYDGEHAHFIGTWGDPSTDGNEMRFGFVYRDVVGGFLPSSGDTSTQDVSAAHFRANQWTCVEWEVIRGGDVDIMRGWVDGQSAFAAEDATKESWNQLGEAHYSENSMNNIVFGWRTFSSSVDTSDIWFDDIIVSTDRVGCN